MDPVLLLVTAVAAAATALPVEAAPTHLEAPVRSGILDAEWDFIRHCERAGVKASFLEAFHPGGLVFNPEPANGREWYAKQPKSRSRLSWYPAISFTAASDELGYNAGPWEWRPDPESEAKAFGWFLTVWKRDDSGAWKLFWDIGIPLTDRALGVAALKAGARTGGKASPASAALSEQLALDLDRGFAAKARESGLEHAYRTFLAPEGRVFRRPSQPATGWGPVRSLLAASPGSRTWEPKGTAVARSGEILFIHGGYSRTVEGKSPETGTYIRIWRRLGTAWTLELDLESPRPPKPEK